MRIKKMLLAHQRGLKWTVKWTGVALACALLAACASPRQTPAPVEDRSARHAPAPGAEPARVAPAPAVATDNAGKPGYFTVRPGDTLIRIALESGQNWRDIARWNGLDNPNVIEVGQVLRVAPPGTLEASAPRSLPPASAASAPVAAASAASAPRIASSSASAGASPAVPPEEEVAWTWPTAAGTSVLAGFDEQKNKGLDIGGKAGEPVLAAADGRVVYAGAGLRGYGNLIILKHNNTYLTAYAHNQSLLVKEDQAVRKGQKIAEMGNSDTDRVKLHFEIRRQGKPVDPSRYLPAR
jgi:lipoprotein NlpD